MLKKIGLLTGVIQNCALPFSSVIGTGLYASLRASDTGPIFLLEEEPRSFELHPRQRTFNHHVVRHLDTGFGFAQGVNEVHRAQRQEAAVGKGSKESARCYCKLYFGANHWFEPAVGADVKISHQRGGFYFFVLSGPVGNIGPQLSDTLSRGTCCTNFCCFPHE